jgi:hypothetical protein
VFERLLLHWPQKNGLLLVLQALVHPVLALALLGVVLVQGLEPRLKRVFRLMLCFVWLWVNLLRLLHLLLGKPLLWFVLKLDRHKLHLYRLDLLRSFREQHLRLILRTSPV